LISLGGSDGSEIAHQAGLGLGFQKGFDTSGKSPAYLHHRRNQKARAGKSAAGFLCQNLFNRNS
jgi:hypothetical protein